jgi:hypothetical protein
MFKEFVSDEHCKLYSYLICIRGCPEVLGMAVGTCSTLYIATTFLYIFTTVLIVNCLKPNPSEVQITTVH